MLKMFVLSLSLYNIRNRGVFLLCKITNLLIYSIMNEIKKDKASRMLPPLESLQNLPQEEINNFDKVMGKIINDIIVEACDLACWVYRCKFIEGWTLEQMVDEKRDAEQFIVALYYLFEEYIDKPDDNNIKPS